MTLCLWFCVLFNTRLCKEFEFPVSPYNGYAANTASCRLPWAILIIVVDWRIRNRDRKVIPMQDLISWVVRESHEPNKIPKIPALHYIHQRCTWFLNNVMQTLTMDIELLQLCDISLTCRKCRWNIDLRDFCFRLFFWTIFPLFGISTAVCICW